MDVLVLLSKWGHLLRDLEKGILGENGQLINVIHFGTSE